jgi:hypothetical protein
MAQKLPVWNSRMLLLMKHCIDTDECDSKKDFLENIGFEPTNLRDITSGTRSFTVKQIGAAATKYKINVNWIFGLEPGMKRSVKQSSIQILKDAVRSVEAEFGAKK